MHKPFPLPLFPPASSPRTKPLTEYGPIQFLCGWLAGLLPLLCGLSLVAWTGGFAQAVGIIIVFWSPACAAISAVTLQANGLSRWWWSGTLLGGLIALLADAGLLLHLLALL